MTEGCPGPLRQILPAVAATEGGHQQQALEPGQLHLIDHLTIAQIVDRLCLAKTAEGGDDLRPVTGQLAGRRYRLRVEGITADDLDSQSAQLGGYLGTADQGDDPVALLQGLFGEGAAQPAAGSEDECGWHAAAPFDERASLEGCGEAVNESCFYLSGKEGSGEPGAEPGSHGDQPL